MHWRTACSVLIPCLNEARTIADLVSGALSHVDQVVVVDDGSVDDTASAAHNAGAVVLSHPKPLGKGAALRTGLRWLSGQGAQWALLMDGDGQHSIDDIPHFFHCAGSGSASMVVGNRMPSSAQIPWLRRFVNQWMSTRISRLVGQSFPDTQCGFRLLRLEDWRGLAIQTTHFEIESELMVAFARAGHWIDFVPVRVRYDSEQSKIQPFRDGWRWMRWWVIARREHSAKPTRIERTCNLEESSSLWSYDEAVSVTVLREPSSRKPVGKSPPGSGL